MLARVRTRVRVAKREVARTAPLPSGAAAATFPRRVAPTELGKPLSRAAHSAAWTARARSVKTRSGGAKAARPRPVSAASGNTPFATASVRAANASTPALRTLVSATGSRRFRSARVAFSSTTWSVPVFVSTARAWGTANPMRRAAGRARLRRLSSALAKVSGSRPAAAARRPLAWVGRALPALLGALAVRRAVCLSNAASSALGSIRRPVLALHPRVFKASAAPVIQAPAAATRACHSCATRPGPLG